MKSTRLFLFLFLFLIICILPSAGIAGKAYYVDPSQTDSAEDGSYAHPWNSLADVNDHKFSTGDDLYFKAGTKLNAKESLRIDWDGSANDRTIIGAYYGNAKFGLNGRARPVIDGQNTYPKDINTALIIYPNGNGYVTIQDLSVKDSAGVGITVLHVYTSEGASTKHNIVRNCFVDSPGRQGIIFARASYGLIEDCEVYMPCTTKNQTAGGYSYAGSGIEINGMGSESVALYNTIRRCTVSNGWEGIGVYKGARHTTVEYSTIYDCRSFHLYIANSRNATIRYNLIYETTEANQPPNENAWNDHLIVSDCESSYSSVKPLVTGDVKIYKNYLAGGLGGIVFIGNGNQVGAYQKNNVVQENRIVDCKYNFLFSKPDSKWVNNKISDNYSFVFGNVYHSNNYSASGFSWTGNNFNSAVSGNAANSASIRKVSLKNDIDWQNLSPGEVAKYFFDLNTDSGSSATSPSNASNLRIIDIEG